MKHVLIISNIPSPYRTAFFAFLQNASAEYRFSVLYTATSEADRVWKTDNEKLKDTYFLKSKILRVKGGEIGGTAERYIHLPANLPKMLSRLNPDIVIGSEYNPSAVLALFWARAHKKRFIHMTDGTLRSESYIGTVQKLTRKLIISQADAYLASSTKAKEKLLWWKAPEEKITISYLTVDIAPFLALQRAPEPETLLYVGRLSREKGTDLLLEALARTRHPVKLRIVGNDVNAERQKLEQQCRALGLEDRVQWCGYLEGEALRAEYSRATVLAVPSRSDCFGLVLLEAVCAGLPIVGSKYADGVYDLIREGVNGYIADPEDPAAFAACIDAAMDTALPAQSLRQTLSKPFRFEEAAKGYFRAIALAEERK